MRRHADSQRPTPRGRQGMERAGIGVVDLAGPAGPDQPWQRLAGLLARALRELAWNDFLILDHDAAPGRDTPAAWFRTGPRGVECAVSSVADPARASWPEHPGYFRANGWLDPLGTGQPWTSGPHAPHEAAGRALAALREGRGCTDPYGLHWGTGSYPVPEGTTGTLTVIDPRHGLRPGI